MDTRPGDERLRATVELFDLGVGLMRENLRRQFPDACDDDIEQRLRHWLHERPGAEQGDAVGRAVCLSSASR
jgi:hypothetical protein